MEKNSELAPTNYAAPVNNPVGVPVQGQFYASQDNYAPGNYGHGQGTYAQPITSQPHVHSVHTAQVQHHQRVKPVGTWGDSICDWPKNLFPSCYCACCACSGMWILSQMAEKLNIASFQTLMITYCVLYLLAFILNAIFPGSGTMVWLPMLFAFLFAIFLRVRLALRDNIGENGGPCGECCIGFWCFPCSVSQMARHTYGYVKVLDGDGDIFRPDGYAPMEVQHV